MSPADQSSEEYGDADRDRAQLAVLWEQARPAVFAYLTASVYDFHRAEDLLQEVAVAIAGKFHAYDRQRSFLAWAIGIARNQTLLYFREQAKARQHFSDAALRSISDAAEKMSQEDASYKREALQYCLRKTAGRRRRVLDLRYTAGLSIAEIAAQLEITNNAVKITLHRVRTALEECIQRRMARERVLR